MEKLKPADQGSSFYFLILKIRRIMRLTLIISLIGIYQAIAFQTYSQATKLSLEMENSRVKDVLASIEDQSEFYFLYSSKLVDVEKPVTVKASNSRIDEILTSLFKGSDVEYLIMDRQIILSPKAMFNETMEIIAQQQKTVSGTVTDSRQQPLPGVTVIVKGTTTGTITDFNGLYSISNVPETATLVFSFVGMRMQEVVVGNQTLIKIGRASWRETVYI